MKICIVSSCGGHLTEARALLSAYGEYAHFYVLNDQVDLPKDMINNTRYITHSERDWRLLLNLYEAYKILREERPDVILSTGAGPAVPFALVGRLFFGCHILYVETVTRIRSPSLTGRLMYALAHEFIVQWPSLIRYFPRARIGDPFV